MILTGGEYLCFVKNWILIIVGALALSCGNRNTSNNTLTLNFTSTEDYCGGAPISDKEQEDLNQPKPFNGTLYMYDNPQQEGEVIVLKFEKGKCTIPRLQDGKYCVFKGPKAEVEAVINAGDVTDPQCYIEFNKFIYANLTVNSETDEISENLHFICDPCVQPLPSEPK